MFAVLEVEDDSSERILKLWPRQMRTCGQGEVEDDSSERILKHRVIPQLAPAEHEVEDDSSERILKQPAKLKVRVAKLKWKTILQREY